MNIQPWVDKSTHGDTVDEADQPVDAVMVKIKTEKKTCALPRRNK